MVQVRTYLDAAPSGRQEQAQKFQEFEMVPRPGARLAPVLDDQKGFFLFLSIPFDPFEWVGGDAGIPNSATYQPTILKTCVQCHGASGLGSVNSFTRRFSGAPSVITTPISDSDPGREIQISIGWKTTQYSWGLLQGLWSR